MYGRHDPALAGDRAVPHQLSLGQEGAGAIHHVLDTQSVLTLGGSAAARTVSQTSHGRGEPGGVGL